MQWPADEGLGVGLKTACQNPDGASYCSRVLSRIPPSLGRDFHAHYRIPEFTLSASASPIAIVPKQASPNHPIASKTMGEQAHGTPLLVGSIPDLTGFFRYSVV